MSNQDEFVKRVLGMSDRGMSDIDNQAEAEGNAIIRIRGFISRNVKGKRLMHGVRKN